MGAHDGDVMMMVDPGTLPVSGPSLLAALLGGLAGGGMMPGQGNECVLPSIVCPPRPPACLAPRIPMSAWYSALSFSLQHFRCVPKSTQRWRPAEPLTCCGYVTGTSSVEKVSFLLSLLTPARCCCLGTTRQTSAWASR